MKREQMREVLHEFGNEFSAALTPEKLLGTVEDALNKLESLTQQDEPTTTKSSDLDVKLWSILDMADELLNEKNQQKRKRLTKSIKEHIKLLNQLATQQDEEFCKCCGGEKGWTDEDGVVICPRCNGTGNK